MATIGNKKVAKNPDIFICSLCDYTTSRKHNMDKHLSTGKHVSQSGVATLATSEATQKPSFSCEKCNTCYFSRAGLWRHNKKHCYFSEKEPSIDKDMMIMFFKQNQEFQKNLFDFIKENIGSTTNNTNSHNKTKVNMNIFLNETCKDAMNLTDFVNSLQITLADLENVGKLGYAEGISRIFTKGLKELDMHKRPIHCSDLKRETVYIKNENKWEKDGEQLKKAIKQITNKNIRLIPKWKEENPGHQEYHNKNNDEYLKIMYESMGPTDELQEEKDFSKIITNVAKETFINSL